MKSPLHCSFKKESKKSMSLALLNSPLTFFPMTGSCCGLPLVAGLAVGWQGFTVMGAEKQKHKKTIMDTDRGVCVCVCVCLKGLRAGMSKFACILVKLRPCGGDLHISPHHV